MMKRTVYMHMSIFQEEQQEDLNHVMVALACFLLKKHPDTYISMHLYSVVVLISKISSFFID